ncbi:MAG: DUF1573 domain-containing protein [candidate division Zixibacteria bacterium]|nr:DUF1573 domain-containing protein [candidate division Zixibacteria bacterium]
MLSRSIRNLILGIILLLVWAAAASAAPAVQIPDDAFDFGKVAQHAKVNHTFWIKSTGSDTLRITAVVPGCGCTQAPLKDSVLAPGDSTSLEIVFSTLSYRGYITKRPYLETNASDEKTYLKIVAELIPYPEEMKPIRLWPHRLDVSQFTTKPRRRAGFKIENMTDQTLRIIPVDTVSKDFDVTLPDKVGPGETVEGMVIVHKDAVEKAFEQSITFELDDEEGSRFSLPVQRKYRPRDED